MSGEKDGISRFVSWPFRRQDARMIPKGGLQPMNQKKTGEFLKQLRKEKGLTQEHEVPPKS